MCTSDCPANRARVRSITQAGLSLVELIMFIVIVSVGVAGILAVFNVTTRSSADPQIRKQMTAIAESLLEEVSLKPFSFCDPDDPSAALPATTSSAGCTGGSNGANDESRLPLGPEAGEAGRADFDNVSDYNGLSVSPYSDVSGTSFPGYAATVAVAQQQLETTIPLADSLRITITVAQGNEALSLSAYRLRYAPRSLP